MQAITSATYDNIPKSASPFASKATHLRNLYCKKQSTNLRVVGFLGGGEGCREWKHWGKLSFKPGCFTLFLSGHPCYKTGHWAKAVCFPRFQLERGLRVPETGVAVRRKWCEVLGELGLALLVVKRGWLKRPLSLHLSPGLLPKWISAWAAIAFCSTEPVLRPSKLMWCCLPKPGMNLAALPHWHFFFLHWHLAFQMD